MRECNCEFCKTQQRNVEELAGLAVKTQEQHNIENPYISAVRHLSKQIDSKCATCEYTKTKGDLCYGCKVLEDQQLYFKVLTKMEEFDNE